MNKVTLKSGNDSNHNVSDSISKDLVLEMLDNYGSDRLEASLIQIYLDDIGVNDPKNELIKSILNKSEEEDVRKVNRKLENHGIEIDLVNLMRIFELMVPEEDRELNGVFFTPENIVDYIIDETLSGDEFVCDPACGSGAFLIKAAKRLYELSNKGLIEIMENNIYGVDLIDYNVTKTKILLSLLAIKNGEDKRNIDFNVVKGDSLKIGWKKYFPKVMDEKGFDVVVGNPPYVKIQSLEDSTKDFLIENYETVQKGNFNIYIPFIELGMNLINKKGSLVYITPLNYFTTLTGESLREYLQDNKYVEKIMDFNEYLLFEDALTYTAITFFNKKRKSSLEYGHVDNEEKIDNLRDVDFVNVSYSNLNPEKWRLLDKKDYDNIKKIESHRRLDEVSDIHTGIATLKDEVYTIFSTNEDSKFYTKEFEGKKYKIEKDICRELVKIPNFDNEEELKNNKSKIIFPYEPDTLTTIKRLDGSEKEIKKDFKVINKKKMKEEYPKTYSYLQDAKEMLATREKGKGSDYDPWYKYGRKQGIEYTGKRLYITTYSDEPIFLLHENTEALFCNGYAVFPQDIDIEILQRVLNSKIMDYYMKKTSKDIEGGFQCYQKNFIKRFSIPKFTEEEKEFLKGSISKEEINNFLEDKYKVDLT